jgi:chemotaxis protein MotB
MHAFKTAVLATILVALAGCSTWDNRAIFCGGPNPEFKFWPCGDGVPDKVSSAMPAREDPEEKERQRLADELAAAQKQNGTLSSRVSDLERQLAASQALAAGRQAGAGDKDKLAADLAAAKQRIAELERQLAVQDKELAGLRGELSVEMTKLKEAQRGLIRALRPQIEKGDITVDLNNERLLINLASGYLFGSGQDELKPAGADALKQVGAVLKDFPEYKAAVDGHTDNVPIQGALKKKFPSNKELSEARAANAAKALTEGGLGTATAHGYADTKPVEPNTTASGRAKNRRVEVRVTK